MRPPDSIGVRIIKAQTRLGIRSCVAAQKCGLKVSNYSKLRGSFHTPRLDTLVKLARGLETSTDYLLGLTDNVVPDRT